MPKNERGEPFRYGKGSSRALWADEGWFDLRDGWWVKVFRHQNHEVIVVRNRHTFQIGRTAAFECGVLRELGFSYLEGMIMGMKEESIDNAGGTPHRVPRSSMFLVQFPVLGDFLYEDKFESGKPRKLATITIMRGDSTPLKAVLNDRHYNRNLWVTGDDLEDLMLQFESLVSCEGVPWRNDPVSGKKAR